MGEELGAALAVVCVTSWLITLSAFDIRHRRLPNVLTLPGAGLILMGAAITGNGLAAVLGGVTLFAVYAAVHLAAPAALGAGDVKLALGIGALTGAYGVQTWLLCAVGASAVTGLLGVVALARGSQSSLPHGLSMCVAAGVSLAAVCLPVG